MPESTEPITAVLQRHFGHSGLRGAQEPIIRHVLAGRDTLAVMPTGQGKSLCYQLPALLSPGTTLVVSPLIALMKDQVDGLLAKGIPATYINGTLDHTTSHERLQGLVTGQYKLVYVAPERLRSPGFISALQRSRLDRVALDEAHCLSQWGHDFRQDYLQVGPVLEALGRPPILATTATAPPDVQADIIRQLGLRQPAVIVSGFDRPNLRYMVRHTPGDPAKRQKLAEIVTHLKGAGIVYAGTRRTVDEVTAFLQTIEPQTVAYHAGMSHDARSRSQERFMGGAARLVVATNAFGMGMDRPDIRFVVHYDLPGTLEAYSQETGRAGRDGKGSYAVLLYDPADRQLQQHFIRSSCPSVATFRESRDLLAEFQEDGVGLTLAEIGRRLPFHVDFKALETCLATLERLGLAASSRPSPVTYRLIRSTPLAEAGFDPMFWQTKPLREQARLDQMIAYATARSCRRQLMLAYFGEIVAGTSCGSCDVCLGQAETPPLPARHAQRLAKRRETRPAAVSPDALPVFDPDRHYTVADLPLLLRYLTGGTRRESGAAAAIIHRLALQAPEDCRPATSALLGVLGGKQREAQRHARKTLALLGVDIGPASEADTSTTAPSSPYDIGESGRLDLLPDLISLLRNGGDNDRRLSASAIGKLAKLDRQACEPAREALIATLTDAAPQVRQYALKALARLALTPGDIQAIRQVRDTDEKDYNRALAATMLARVGD